MAKGGSRVCARRRSNLLSRKKVTKERPPYCPCPFAALRATCDARAGRGLAELALRAQTDASPDPPAAALLGTATRAQTSIRAIAALGPIKDIRVAVDRSCISRGRAQQRPVWFPALVDAPAAGCLRGGMRAPAHMLRELTRRVCPNGAPQARSELCGEPRKRPAPGLPRRGRRLRGAFLLGTFLWRSKEKYLARRGETRPPSSAQAQAQQQQQQQQPTANSPGHHRPPNLPRVRHPEQHQANQPAHHRPIDPDVLQVLADVQLNKL